MAECEKMMQLCEESLDRTLTAGEQEMLDRHLQSCPDCAAYLADLRFMTAALGEEPPFPAHLHGAIMSGIADEARSTVVQTRQPNRRLPVFTMLAAAAACVVLVLSGALGDLLNTFQFGLGGGMSGSSSGSADAAMPAPASSEGAADAGTANGAADPYLAGAGDADEPAEGKQMGRSATPEDGIAGAAPTETQSAADEHITMTESAGVAISDNLNDLDGGEALQPQVGAFIANVMEGEVFAACYLVEGGEGLPDIGREQQRDSHFGYYVAANNPAQLETLLDALEKAGCTVRTYEEGGVPFNESASRVIFVVRLA